MRPQRPTPLRRDELAAMPLVLTSAPVDELAAAVADRLRDFAPRADRLLLSLTEAAERLGVSDSTVRGWARSEGLPTVRINGTRYVPVRELEAWILARPRGSGEAVERLTNEA